MSFTASAQRRLQLFGGVVQAQSEVAFAGAVEIELAFAHRALDGVTPDAVYFDSLSVPLAA